MKTEDRDRHGVHLSRFWLGAIGSGMLASLATLRAQEALPAPRPLELPRPTSDQTDGSSPVATSRPSVIKPAGDLRIERAGRNDRTPAVTYSEAGLRPGEAPDPGMKVELDLGDDAPAEGTSYRWVQIEGPKVAIPASDRRAIEVEIPEGAERLSFLRMEYAPGQVRVVRFVVPVKSPAQGATAIGRLKADAGDDQVGLVGHRITLNGSKSTPAGNLVYRWIHVAGPPIVASQQQGPFFSFVPTGAGLYQFVLVVGAQGAIAEPDAVSVLVGVAPAGSSPGAASAAGATPGFPAAASLPAPSAIVASALPGLTDGSRLAGEVADVFEAVAGRMSLYSCFGEALSELSRRLDAVIPGDPVQRLAWTRTLLQPLTQYTVVQMTATGLDVRQPAGLNQPLTQAQRDRIQEVFLLLARAFRDAVKPASE